MKTREKVAILRSALDNLMTRFLQVPGSDAHDPTYAEAYRVRALTAPRAQMSAAEKAITVAQRRFDKGNARLVRWLTGVGIKTGGYGIHKVDGQRVAFLSDPQPGPTGLVIDAQMPHGAVEVVDPLAYRPDYAAIDLAGKPAARATRKPQEVKPAPPVTVSARTRKNAQAKGGGATATA